jgi:hypothetical protein
MKSVASVSIARGDSQGAHEALAALARRTQPVHLLTAECAGLTAILLIIARDAPLQLSLPFIAVIAFGVWGLADSARRSSVSRTSRSFYSFFQLVMTLIGAAALLVIPLALGEIAIGTIIS